MKSFVEVTREEVKDYKRQERLLKMLKKIGRNSYFGQFGVAAPILVKVPEEVYCRVVQFGRRQQIQNLYSVGSSPTTATSF